MKKPTLTTQFQIVTSLAVAIGCAAVGLIISLLAIEDWKSSVKLNAFERFPLELHQKFLLGFAIAIAFFALALCFFGIDRARKSQGISWPPGGQPECKREDAHQADPS
jgi:hypothetical protein